MPHVSHECKILCNYVFCIAKPLELNFYIVVLHKKLPDHKSDTQSIIWTLLELEKDTEQLLWSSKPHMNQTSFQLQYDLSSHPGSMLCLNLETVQLAQHNYIFQREISPTTFRFLQSGCRVCGESAKTPETSHC